MFVLEDRISPVKHKSGLTSLAAGRTLIMPSLRDFLRRSSVLSLYRCVQSLMRKSHMPALLRPYESMQTLQRSMTFLARIRAGAPVLQPPSIIADTPLVKRAARRLGVWIFNGAAFDFLRYPPRGCRHTLRTAKKMPEVRSSCTRNVSTGRSLRKEWCRALCHASMLMMSHSAPFVAT